MDYKICKNCKQLTNQDVCPLCKLPTMSFEEAYENGVLDV